MEKTHRIYCRTIVPLISLAVAVSVSMTACTATRGDGATPHEAHRQEVDAWFEKRVKKLKHPAGYLSIVGLYWLHEGKNTFGSDPSNEVVFPDRAPKFVGTFNLVDGVVTVDITPGVTVTHEGNPVTTMQLRPDTEEDRSVLEYETLSWYVIVRGEKVGIRVIDGESDIRLGFKGIERFPVDGEWRFEAVLDRYEPMKFIPVGSVIDVVTSEPCVGAVVFEIDGESYRLDAIVESHSPKLWVIFADDTNGLETYPGGRYLYLDPPDEYGNMIIDFNTAENPPCAFSDYTTCPLPPPQNRLPLRVTVGEKSYKKLKK